jgi:DNA-binding NtrC family response regulator
MLKILVADDDASLRLTVSSALSDHFLVDQAEDGIESLRLLQKGNYDLALLDVQMPKLNGIEVLKKIKAYNPSTIIIILTAFSHIEDAVCAIKEGAYHYLEKPIELEKLIDIVENALHAKKMIQKVSFSAPVFQMPHGSSFLGHSNAMQTIFEMIQKLSRVDSVVLIRGESGTGKELVAQALHYNGPRKQQRFVSVNCAAITETLIESEFFGHEKGAFTGADSRKIGKFQYADGGTLFLDEIGDISPSMQVKLLRVLQEKTFTPVGSNREIQVNVRIIAATHRNLEAKVAEGTFREDLFYRLNVLAIELPPLRERKNDLEELAYHFIKVFGDHHHKSITSISEEAMHLLKNHPWHGNIRELGNVIEHAFVMESSSIITPASLPRNLHAFSTEYIPEFSEVLDFQAKKEAFERQFLIQALKTFKGKINQTALHANIPKKTLIRKLEKYGINPQDYDH